MTWWSIPLSALLICVLVCGEMVDAGNQAFATVSSPSRSPRCNQAISARIQIPSRLPPLMHVHHVGEEIGFLYGTLKKTRSCAVDHRSRTTGKPLGSDPCHHPLWGTLTFQRSTNAVGKNHVVARVRTCVFTQPADVRMCFSCCGCGSPQ